MGSRLVIGPGVQRPSLGKQNWDKKRKNSWPLSTMLAAWMSTTRTVGAGDQMGRGGEEVPRVDTLSEAKMGSTRIPRARRRRSPGGSYLTEHQETSGLLKVNSLFGSP